MSANTDPIHPKTPQSLPVAVTAADGTNKKIVRTAGENGARLDSLHICNDGAAKSVDFYVNAGGDDGFIGRVTVPAGAGYDTAWQEGLVTLNGGYSMVFGANVVIKAALTEAMAAGKTLTILPLCGDY